MKKVILGILMLLCGWTSVSAAEKSFSSPDGQLTVWVDDVNGAPAYRVMLGETEFIERSPLGVKTNIGDFTQNLTLTGCEIKKVQEQYQLSTIKQSTVNYEATEAVCSFEQQGRKVIDVVFRVSNRDVAYSYTIYP